jgi:hypothetical protein
MEQRALLVEARLSARPGWQGWLLALIAAAVLVVAAWGFQTQVERWVLRATLRAVHDEEPKRIDDRLVGRWLAPTGARILISRSGVVWYESGDLIGTGAFDGAVPSRFTFEGPGFRCVYDLAVGRDYSDWRRVEGSAGPACPEGRFVRSFAS